jgi:hypothetical protein
MRRQASNLRRSSLYRRKSSSVIAVLNWSASDNHLETDLAQIIGCPEAIQQGGAKKLAGLVTGSQLAGRDLRSMITIYDCRQHSMSWVGYGEDIPANWIGNADRISCDRSFSGASRVSPHAAFTVRDSINRSTVADSFRGQQTSARFFALFEMLCLTNG